MGMKNDSADHDDTWESYRQKYIRQEEEVRR